MSPQPASAPYQFVCSAEPSGSQTLPVTRDASPQPGGPAEWTERGERLSSETGLYSMREPASAALSAEDVCLRDGFTPDSQAASSVEGESSPRGLAGRGRAGRGKAGLGAAGQGGAWQGVAGQDKSRVGSVRRTRSTGALHEPLRVHRVIWPRAASSYAVRTGPRRGEL